MPRLEQGTRIVNMVFGTPVPKDLVKPQMTLREIEVVRACFDGGVTTLRDGAHTLFEANRVQTEVSVKDGKGDVRTVHPNAVPNVEEMYGKLPHTKLDEFGQTYVYDMKDGKVVGMVACVREKYQP